MTDANNIDPAARSFRMEATLTYAEAGEAAGAVARFLDLNALAIARIADRLRWCPPMSVTTCARGSSDAAATHAKYLIETLIGVPTTTS